MPFIFSHCVEQNSSLESSDFQDDDNDGETGDESSHTALFEWPSGEIPAQIVRWTHESESEGVSTASNEMRERASGSKSVQIGGRRGSRSSRDVVT